MAYTGSSIVDYLKSVGKASDYASRSALASQSGITGYTGTAEQNTSLLSKLMGGAVAPVSPAVPVVPTPVVPTSSSGTSPQITDLQSQVAALKALQDKLSASGAGAGANIDPTTGVITPAKVTTSVVPDVDSGSTVAQTDSQKALADMIAKMNTQFDAYSTALSSQPTATETYTKYRDLLGIPAQEAEYTAAEKAVAGTNQLISDTENLINNLEGDINTRISGLSTSQPVLEAQRRRLLAGEQKPLTEQLSGLTQQLGKQQTVAGMEQTDVSNLSSQLAQMLSLAGQDQTNALAAAKAPLDYESSMLPTLTAMAEYQSPADKLSQQIAYEQKQKELGLGDYATTTEPTKLTTIGNAETGFYSFDPATGKTTQLTTGTGGDAWSTPVYDAGMGKFTSTNSKTGETKTFDSGTTGTAGTTGTTGTLTDIGAQTLDNLNYLINAEGSMASTIGYVPIALTSGETKVQKAKLEQVVNQLSVNARALIKGQGAISDKETAMLASSQSILKAPGLTVPQIMTELRKVRGIINANAGQIVPVTTVKGDKSVDVDLNREDIYSAIQQGYTIIYR